VGAREAAEGEDFGFGVVHQRADLREVDGGVASYQFCELRVDVRQGNQGNVEAFLQARYP
jgi:hypothetical protein